MMKKPVVVKRVPSKTNPNFSYTIRRSGRTLSCDCPQGKWSKDKTCHHIRALTADVSA